MIFDELQAAGRAGLLQGSTFPCPCPGYEDFGQESKEDTNNIAPRAGFTYDVKADGRLILRGGVGRYYDFAYTNANLLFPVYGAQVPFGQVYSVTNSAGIRNPDGSLFQVGQPLPPNQLTNLARPLPSGASTPQHQAALQRPGEPRVLQGPGDALRGRGRRRVGRRARQGMRPRLNARVNGGAAVHRLPAPVRRRQLADVHPGRREPVSRRQPDPEAALGREAAAPRQLHALRGEVHGQPATPPTSSATSTSSTRSTSSTSGSSGTCAPMRATGSPRARCGPRPPASRCARSSATARRRRTTRSPASTTTTTGSTSTCPRTARSSIAGAARTSARSTCASPRGSASAGARRSSSSPKGFNLLNDTNPGTFVENMTSEQFGQPIDVRGRLRAERAEAVPVRRALRVLAYPFVRSRDVAAARGSAPATGRFVSRL